MPLFIEQLRSSFADPYLPRALVCCVSQPCITLFVSHALQCCMLEPSCCILQSYIQSMHPARATACSWRQRQGLWCNLSSCLCNPSCILPYSDTHDLPFLRVADNLCDLLPHQAAAVLEARTGRGLRLRTLIWPAIPVYAWQLYTGALMRRGGWGPAHVRGPAGVAHLASTAAALAAAILASVGEARRCFLCPHSLFQDASHALRSQDMDGRDAVLLCCRCTTCTARVKVSIVAQLLLSCQRGTVSDCWQIIEQ